MSNRIYFFTNPILQPQHQLGIGAFAVPASRDCCSDSREKRLIRILPVWSFSTNSKIVSLELRGY